MVVATSALLLTACLESQEGATDSADAPPFSNQAKSNPENAGQVKIIGAQSSPTPISGERQDGPKPSEPGRRQPTLSSVQAAPGPDKLSTSQQVSGSSDQVNGNATVITPQPEPPAQVKAAPSPVAEPSPESSAQAQAAPSPLAEPPIDTPLQSSRAVEVNVRQFRQLLPRDAIAPIYTPEFLPASQASLNPGELVIGVAIGGESKAYPIGPLVSREMVNDVIAGVPILVTW